MTVQIDFIIQRHLGTFVLKPRMNQPTYSEDNSALLVLSKRMKSALHAFVAYMSHYHSVEWNNYMENQTPSSVNDLYKVGWKDYASKVFVDKPETWKKWNTISASTIAQHKNFTKFCDTLMETMNIEKRKKKSSQREWKVKFPTMTIV